MLVFSVVDQYLVELAGNCTSACAVMPNLLLPNYGSAWEDGTT